MEASKFNGYRGYLLRGAPYKANQKVLRSICVDYWLIRWSGFYLGWSSHWEKGINGKETRGRGNKGKRENCSSVPHLTVLLNVDSLLHNHPLLMIHLVYIILRFLIENR